MACSRNDDNHGNKDCPLISADHDSLMTAHPLPDCRRPAYNKESLQASTTRPFQPSNAGREQMLEPFLISVGST